MTRLVGEFKRYANQLKRLKATLDSNTMTVDLEITGPSGSYYDCGLFQFKMIFPNNYPLQPPLVKCSNIFHINMKEDGTLSKHLLKSTWTPEMKICDIVDGIIVPILINPNTDPKSLENMHAFDLLSRCHDEYIQKIQGCVQKTHETNIDKGEHFF